MQQKTLIIFPIVNILNTHLGQMVILFILFFTPEKRLTHFYASQTFIPQNNHHINALFIFFLLFILFYLLFLFYSFYLIIILFYFIIHFYCYKTS